jgi:hypothetical protein
MGPTGATGRAGGTGPTGSSITGHGTATAVAGTATLNANAGLVTSESLSGVTTYTLTLINSSINVNSIVYTTAYTVSSTIAAVTNITPTGGSVSIQLGLSASYSGTIKIAFMVSN